MRRVDVLCCLVIVLLGVSCRLTSCGGTVPKAIDVVVRLSKDEARILYASPTETVPLEQLREPAVVQANWTDFSPGTQELIAEFQQHDGQVLAAYGFAGTSLQFTDSAPDQHRPEAAGRPREVDLAGLPSTTVDDRLLHLPVPRGAEFLVFYRTAVLDGIADDRVTGYEAGELVGVLSSERTRHGPAHVIRTLLTTYRLDPASSDMPDARPPWPWPPPPGPQPFTPERIVIPPDRVLKMKLAPERLPCPPTPWCGRGYDLGSATIFDQDSSTGPDAQFDVVIAGDGYQDLDAYKIAAKAFSERLLETEPFLTNRAQIAIHRLDLASREEGLSVRQDSGWVTKKTYLGVWGTPWNPVVDMPCPCQLYTAARRIADLAQLELFVLIGNSDAPGGKAKPDQRLALFPSIEGDADTAFQYARHELGHALTGAMEEDIRPGAWKCRNPLRAQCNLAVQSSVDNGTVWWLQLAADREKSGNGFKAVHKQGDPTTGDCGMLPDFPATPHLRTYLGVFWGAQFIDIAVPPGCTSVPWHDPPDCCLATTWDNCSRFNDARGARFYRPQASCAMRFLEEPEFCAVCRHEIEQAILGHSWGPSPLCCEGQGLPGMADGC